MIRRILVSVLLVGLFAASVWANRQADQANEDFQPDWVEYTGPPEKRVGTPMLSVRRTPGWIAEPIADQRLANALNAVVNRPEAPASTCLVVYRNDQLVIDSAGDVPLLPASLMKIVTATAFLEKIDPESSYTTEVVVRSDVMESAADGVLTGDIYLVGGGDPVLSTPDYIERYSEPRAYTDITVLADRVASTLTQHGINTIDGGVIADESRYPEEERDYTNVKPREGAAPIWKSSYVTTNQVGPLSALLLNDGFSSFSSSTSSAGRRQNVRATDPARHAADIFDDLIEERGFTIRERTGKGVAPTDGELVTLGTVESPPRSEIVARMLRYSDNTTAEMAFKEVGHLAEIGSTQRITFFAVFQAVQRLLDLASVVTEEIIISDGSGLSTYNRLTCRIVAELLRQAGPGSPLVEGLAVAGQSGTLRNCEADALPVGASPTGVRTVLAKTGTLNDASALAGLTVADNGDVITFALISNDTGIITTLGFCNILQRMVMAAVIGHPYGPSATDASLQPLPAISNASNAPDKSATPVEEG